MTYTKKETIIQYLIQIPKTRVRLIEPNKNYRDNDCRLVGISNAIRIHHTTFKFLINQEIVEWCDCGLYLNSNDYKLNQSFLDKHPFLTQICGMTEVLAKRRYDDWHSLTMHLTTRDENIPEVVWEKWEEFWDGWKKLPKAMKALLP